MAGDALRGGDVFAAGGDHPAEPTAVAPGEDRRARQFWLGGYTADMDGSAEGISAVRLNADGTLGELRLAVATPSPSFVATHPALPVVYAVGEKNATLRAFALADETRLEPLGGAWPAGEGACHVAVAPNGRVAIVACWGSGQVLVYGLDPATGAIISRREAAAAADPYVGVPEAELVAPHPDDAPRTSRAHCTQFLADGRVLTTDLGFDLARFWRLDEESAALSLDHEVAFPFGTGPRHLALAGDGTIFVIAEYAVTVSTLKPGSDGRYALAASSPVRAVPREDGEAAAHLTLSPDGRMLYATVRGSNVVGVLAVAPGGAVRPVAEAPAGGDGPRHHLLLGGRLYVANQRSDEVTVLELDDAGLPGSPVQRIPAPAPTVIAQ